MQIESLSRAAELPIPDLAVTASATRTISLANGFVALCDEEDFAFLSRFTWWSKKRGVLQAPFTRVGGEMLYMHQLLLLNDEKCRVNHRDGNVFNNCRANLRVATNTQIQAAKGKSTKRIYTSQYKGVSRRKGDTVWRAAIKCLETNLCLGNFETEEAAARAYDRAAREMFGEFAYQNFSPTESSAHANNKIPVTQQLQAVNTKEQPN